MNLIGLGILRKSAFMRFSVVLLIIMFSFTVLALVERVTGLDVTFVAGAVSGVITTEMGRWILHSRSRGCTY